MIKAITSDNLTDLKQHGNEFLERAELADVLGVHVQHVEYWNRSGKITKYKEPGKRPYYVRDEVYRDLSKALKPKKSRYNTAKTVLIA